MGWGWDDVKDTASSAVNNVTGAITGGALGGVMGMQNEWFMDNLGGGIFSPGDVETGMSEYDTWLMGQQQGIMDQLQEASGAASPYADSQQQAIMNMLSGNANTAPQMQGINPVVAQQAQTQQAKAMGPSSQVSSTGYDPEAVDSFYRDTIRDPAMRGYEEETRPAWMAKVGNLHSSHRDNMEQKGYENLMSQLRGERAGLHERARNRGIDQDFAAQQFNVGAQQFDINQGNQMNQFNALQGNQMNQYNAGQANQMNQFNAQLGQQSAQQNLAAQLQTMGLNQQGQQFGLQQAMQYDPQQQYYNAQLAMLGMKPDSWVAQDPSLVQQAGGAGPLAAFMAA